MYTCEKCKKRINYLFMSHIIFKRVFRYFGDEGIWQPIILLMSITTFFLCACGNASLKKSYNEEANNEASVLSENVIVTTDDNDVDIPISVNLAHTEDEELKQYNASEYNITKETDEDIYIDINSKYYKNYLSGKRFKVPRPNILFTEDFEFLTLELDIVNNTNSTLDINELDLLVDESKEDRLPFIFIRTSNDLSNSISFINGSWFNWEGFTFSYKILRKGESFDGTYKKSMHIPYFEKQKTIDLLPDMKEMGYDFDEIVKCIKQDNEEHGWNFEPVEYCEDGYCLGFGISKDDENLGYFQRKFEPFELIVNEDDEIDGIARLYGTVQFDNSDTKVDFSADISLFGRDFGAGSYVNDKFDVKLRSQGNNYTLRYPYTTVIEPYGTELVKLTVRADKSSSHKFNVILKNGNDLMIKSKTIHFHHFYPSH